MGSITDIFELFADTIFSFIDAGSAAAEGLVGTGSSAANGFSGIVEGALGSVSN